VAIAVAVQIAARRAAISATEFLTEVADTAAELDDSVSKAIREMRDWVDLPPLEATECMGRLGIEPTFHESWLGVSSFATSSVCWSLYAFLRSPDDYWQSVCTAIWVGGDTDTTAAMTGSIAGGRVGLRGLPAPLVQQLTDRGRWNAEGLVGVAEGCHRAIATRPGD
jgi:ADP-ribosylglycohydrolase